jgi:hypothetical protein
LGGQEVDWNWNPFDWAINKYYTEDDISTLILPNCSEATNPKTYYKIIDISGQSTWQVYSCIAPVNTYYTDTVDAISTAFNACSDFSYDGTSSRCPASCSITAKCSCPNG